MNEPSQLGVGGVKASPRVAVVGGGISGLSAAHRLIELLPNARLTLFETSARLGGVLDTFHRDGFLIERSADNFLTKTPWAVELCQRLGMVDELLPTDETRRRALVLRDGALVPIPDGFFLMSPRKLMPLLRSPILSWHGKLRLLIEPLVPRGHAWESGMLAERAAGTDESVASFARRRLGREAFERLVQPLVSGVYTADPEKLSMAAALPEFFGYERQYGSLLRATLLGHSSSCRQKDAEQGALAGGAPRSKSAEEGGGSGARYGLFVAPREGMSSLVAALANRLPNGTIRPGAVVQSVRQIANGLWRLEFLAGEQELFDALIVAVPAQAAAKILAPCDSALSSELAGIHYAGCAVVSLALPIQNIGRPLDGFGFVVPIIEGRRIIAASFASEKFPGRAPADFALIRVFIGGALQPELAELPDDALGRLAIEEIGPILQISGEPLWVDIARCPQSMPQYHVGHIARVDRIERLTAQLPGLELAGNAYHGVGIPQCVRSGEAAAERIAARYSSI